MRSSRCARRSSGHCVAASLGARSGSGWVSRKNPSAPATAAAASSDGMHSRSPAAGSPLALPGSLGRMGGVEHHRHAGGATQPPEISHVHHEVAVAEEGAAFRDGDVPSSPAPHLLDRSRHARRRHPLPFLHVHRTAGATRGHEQVGLAAEKRRDLKHVRHFRGTRRLIRLVDVGQYRKAGRRPNSLERAEAFVQPRAARSRQAGPVGLVETRLEAHRHAPPAGVGGQHFADSRQHVARLHHAGTRDHERGAGERPCGQREASAIVLTAGDSPLPRDCRRRNAAPMNPANRGWGRVGRDLSSGWNWQPMNQA